MNNGWQYKMQQFELSPPPGVWDKIAAALDESELGHEFPSKLHELELTPPSSAWNRIKYSLDRELEAAVPEHRKLSPLLRYAAAAVIIGMVAWGTTFLFSGKKVEQKMTKTTSTEKDSIPAAIDKDKNGALDDGQTASDQARDDAALEASKHSFASLDISVTNRIRQKTRNYFPESVELSRTGAQLNPEETYRELIFTDIIQPTTLPYDRNENLASRYIMLMTPDGNIIRMSKKWSSLLCCVSGEEQDEDCKAQLKKWREKIAGSSGSPSTGNFMDILSLVKSLEDNFY